jgi:hypothetical protein
MRILAMSMLAAALLTGSGGGAKAGCFLFFCWPDTKGTAVTSCPQASLIQHKFTATKHTYRFQGQCTVSTEDSAWNEPYIADGTWDGTHATEVTQFNGGKVTAKVLCPYDPWLYGGICPLESVTAPSSIAVPFAEWLKGPFPRTAYGMSAALRSQLQGEHQYSQQIPTPEAPQFLTPVCGVTSPLSKSVTFKVKRNINFNLAWKFEWRAGLSLWTEDGTYKQLGFTVSQGDTVRRTIKFGKAGYWRITVTSIFPGAPSTSCQLLVQ